MQHVLPGSQLSPRRHVHGFLSPVVNSLYHAVGTFAETTDDHGVDSWVDHNHIDKPVHGIYADIRVVGNDEVEILVVAGNIHLLFVLRVHGLLFVSCASS